MGVLLIFLTQSLCYGAVFSFEIFTENGDYYDNPGVNLYVDVNDGSGKANFTFYNDSEFDCSTARIYFDDGSIFGIDYIMNGPGTEFDRAPEFPGPGDLPNGEDLVPPFETDREFTIGALSPPPENGVNSIPAGEWVKISFDLTNGGTLDDVISELYTGQLRVGLHVISFPDGSSESAILIPEPCTLTLFALGAGLFLRLRKKH
ncbi:hypothetical protein ES703_45639 [subsurface metagenome]